jgi:hypothetical protein
MINLTKYIIEKLQTIEPKETKNHSEFEKSFEGLEVENTTVDFKIIYWAIENKFDGFSIYLIKYDINVCIDGTPINNYDYSICEIIESL